MTRRLCCGGKAEAAKREASAGNGDDAEEEDDDGGDGDAYRHPEDIAAENVEYRRLLRRRVLIGTLLTVAGDQMHTRPEMDKVTGMVAGLEFLWLLPVVLGAVYFVRAAAVPAPSWIASTSGSAGGTKTAAA